MTGKGGVGKTTVAAALGLAAARAGKRTMICEVAEQERISQAFGSPPAGFTETEMAENLHAISIDPEDAQEEWLRVPAALGRAWRGCSTRAGSSSTSPPPRRAWRSW